MGIVGMRLRAEWRRHWLGLIGLALLLGIASGAVLTAAAGARRTSSTIEHTLARSRSADVLVNPDDLDAAGARERW